MKNNFIKKIDEAIISQIIEGDSSAYDEILKEQGYNVIDIESYANKNFKKHSFLLRGLINKKKDLILLEKASLLLQNAIEKNIDKTIEYWIKSSEQGFEVAKNSLEKLCKESPNSCKK